MKPVKQHPDNVSTYIFSHRIYGKKVSSDENKDNSASFTANRVVLKNNSYQKLMRYFFRAGIPDKSVEINPDLPNLSRLSRS